MDDIISNILGENKEDFILYDGNVIFQLTSTENQINNKNNNRSTINLKNCESKLKEYYNISQNDSLLIFKVDYYKEGALSPVIGYEIYHPIEKYNLNLSVCSNITINLNIPVTLNEDNLYKYDPKNEYYTDECRPSTTENGTDILLKDRQNEFNEKGMSVCEKNCSYNGYNNRNVECECGVKYELLLISDLENKNDLFSYEFNDKNDMITIKCYKTLFTKDGLKSNIGSYILLFIILLFLVSIILFYKCGYIMLEEKIDKIYKLKINENYNNNSIKETEDKHTKIIYKNKKKFKSKKLKKASSKHLNKNIKKKNNKKNNNNTKTISKLVLKNNKFLFYSNDNNKKYKEKSNSKGIISLNDYKLNLLSFQDAKRYDKRTCSAYYFSLIKTRHPLIFTFCLVNDYNSLIIKICLLFLSFSIYYFINNLFFDESVIHKIYEDKGSYNFSYLIPYISYSFAISHTLSIIIKYIFLSERNLNQLNNEENKNNLGNVMEKVKKCIILKYISFFISSLIFLIFFWYYLSSFGAVFHNTQIYLIKNTLISFGFELLFPFFINIIASILRINALTSNKNLETIYKISIIMQYI